MSAILEKLKAKMLGEMSDEEKAVKANADKAAANYETETGAPAPEEPGIEPDYTLEDAASIALTGPAAGMARKAGSLAVNKAGRAGIEKLKEKGPPPAFHEAVKAGETGTGPSNFAKFIRGEAKEVAKDVKKPESLQVPRMGTSDKAKDLMAEREILNLKTPAGRDRLKEIDQILANRTYFKE
jgi:hypothetical protein